MMAAERSTLDPVWKKEYDTRICAALIDWVDTNKASVVHAYLPIGSEIDIQPAILHWLGNRVQVVCPKALPARKMVNLELFTMEDLEKGPFNTRHPAHSTPFPGEYDLIVIPGLAFDRNNMRLGYGSGYYDAFLKEQSGHRLGICYPFQLIEKVPFSEHDTRLDDVLCFS